MNNICCTTPIYNIIYNIPGKAFLEKTPVILANPLAAEGAVSVNSAMTN
jgi:hypothetical protein